MRGVVSLANQEGLLVSLPGAPVGRLGVYGMAAPSSSSSSYQDPLAALLAVLAAMQQGGAPPPLILLAGSCHFYLDRAVAAVKAAVLQPATADFNYDLLYAKEAGVARVMACAKTLPMMASHRLVLVRDCEDWSASDLAALLPYLQSPGPETCLCLITEKADMRQKFFTTFQKVGLLLKLEPPSERQLAGFVEAEAKHKKLGLQAGVASRIADEIGADLGQIVDALERLSCYVAEGAKVSLADVEEIVTTTKQHSVFALIDAVGGRNVSAAWTLLAGLLGAQEPALKLLALLARHTRQLWQTTDLLDHGSRSASDVAGALGVPPFVATKLIEQARRLSTTRIALLHEAIYQTDRTLKLSKLDDLRVMESLLLRLCAS